jgi:polyhydroxyalkanoate synthesis regulator phasin
MVLDGLRGYLQLANGLTDVTRERALATAKALAAQGAAGVTAVVPAPAVTQVSTLTEDLMAASKANRALLLHLIQAEIERSVARLGLVSAHELDAANRRAKGLERRVAELEEELRRSSTARKAAVTRAKKAPAKKSAAKKSTAKKSATKKSATKSAARTPARRSPGAATPAAESSPTTAPAAESTPTTAPAAESGTAPTTAPTTPTTSPTTESGAATTTSPTTEGSGT